MRYLIVSVDALFAHHLRAVLRTAGVNADIQSGGTEPRPGCGGYLREDAVDAILLDVSGLSRHQGASCTRQWARVGGRGNLPVMVITRRDGAPDVPALVTAGASGCHDRDDDVRVLVARMQAMTLRWQGHYGPGPVVGSLTLDLLRRRVTVGGEEIPLTRMEFRILEVLVRYHGRVLRRNELLLRLYADIPEDGREHVLAVLTGRLRHKLELAGVGQAVVTVRGVGYLFDLRMLPGRQDSPPVRTVRERREGGHRQTRARRAGWTWAGRV